MKHFCAVDTILLLNNRDQNITQHLELDVVKTSSTKKEKESLDDYKLVCDCLLCLITALSNEVLSGDLWALSIIQAKHIAEDYGIPKEKFKEVMGKVINIQSQIRKGNPMSGMF